jgi:hypothetical protein
MPKKALPALSLRSSQGRWVGALESTMLELDVSFFFLSFVAQSLHRLHGLGSAGAGCVPAAMHRLAPRVVRLPCCRLDAVSALLAPTILVDDLFPPRFDSHFQGWGPAAPAGAEY